MANKKLYSVSLCFVRDNNNGSCNIGMSCRTILADSEGDAFISVYDAAKNSDFANHQLMHKVVYEINPELYNKTPTP